MKPVKIGDNFRAAANAQKLSSMLRAVLGAEAGTALVELTLVTPVLLLLMIGLTEVGRFAYFSILVGNAASAGVQYGAQNLVTADDSTGMQNAAKNDGQNITGLTATATNYCECSDGSNLTSPCNAVLSCSSNHQLYYVQVTTSGTFSSLFHYPGVPTSVTVIRKAVMRVINP